MQISLRTNAELTVVGRRLHRVDTSSRMSDVRQEVNARLHECDLEAERIVTGGVEQLQPGLAEQPVQSTVPAVQVVLIQLVWNMYTKHG